MNSTSMRWGRRTFAVAGLAVATAMWVAAPAFAAPADAVPDCPGASARNTQVVRIGHVSGVTGMLASVGRESEQAARMAVSDLNATCPQIGERPVRFELVAEDDGHDLQRTARVARKLVKQKVNGVVGHLGGASTLAASKIYHEAGIPLIAAGTSASYVTREGLGTVFRVLVNDDRMARLLARYAVDTLYNKRVVIIDDQTAYGLNMAKAFEQTLLELEGSVAGHESTPPEYWGVASGALSLVEKKKPQLIFLATGEEGVAAKFVDFMRRRGVDTRMMAGDAMCLRDLPRIAGADAIEQSVFCGESGLMFSDMSDPVALAFDDRFRARYGESVYMYGAEVYDAVNVMAQAMIAAGSAEPARYLRALAQTSYTGITGPIAFDERGDNKHAPMKVYTYKKGRRVVVGMQRMPTEGDKK